MSHQQKKSIQEHLVSMGFEQSYISRAFKVYEKNYGHNYNIEVITEIIVRLQNKDKAKKQKKTENNNKDKSPQPQSSPKKQKNSNNNNDKIAKPAPQQKVSKSSPLKPSKLKPKPSPNEVSKPSKNIKKDRNQMNVNTNSSSKQPKIKSKSNQMKTESPPKAYSGPNYGQTQHINKQKRKPNKPPPTNPLPPQSHKQMSYNGNMNNNNNNNNGMHQKSHSQSQFKPSPSRPSPSAPPRFKQHDIVLYNGIEAEVHGIRNDGRIDITYPIQKYIMSRNKATVHPHDITKKKAGMSGQQRQTYNIQPRQQSSPYNNSPSPRHQYSQSHNVHSVHNINTKSAMNKKPNTAPQLQQSKPSNDHNNINANSAKGNNNIKKEEANINMPPFQSHMTFEEANKLECHNKIDHRDQVGRFVYATVSEKQGTNLKIHYDGWSRKWDTWSDFSLEIHRFAIAGSISKRAAHRFRQLKKGDYVDINPTQRHPGWKCGEIRRLDQKSGQVQVVYESLDKNYLYWAHLDNIYEIAEFTSKSGLNHTTQMDIMKKTDLKPQQEQEQEQEQEQQAAVVEQPVVEQQQQQQVSQMSPMDEMEAFARIRQKRFPRYPNEKINNPYGVGDWLEVQDTQTHQWITATVIDKENNWIVVHFDGWPSKYDQKIHALKHEKRLRDLGSGLQETQEEKDIREEMNNFLKEVENLNWKLIEVDADGNCLYRCFAINIYNDTTKHMSVRKECCNYMSSNKDFFQNFIPDFDLRMGEKEQEYEWGDHVDITALSELYNVRVRVFEYDKDGTKLYMSFDQGEHEETVNLPLILLARHRKKHYNIITDPQAVHRRPLNTAKYRKEHSNDPNYILLKELRLREDAKEKCEEEKNENKDDEKDIGNNDMDMNMNIDNGNMSMVSPSSLSSNNISNSYSLRNLNNLNSNSLRNFNQYTNNSINSNVNVIGARISLEQHEFIDVLETWNLSEPLQSSELKNIFRPLVNKIYKKIEFQIQNNHKEIINKDVLNRFWKQQFEQQPQCNNNCKRWISALKEKIPNQQYTQNACLNTFNQTIVAPVLDNLASIINSSRKRQSTIDIHRQQPMDIDQ